MEDGNYLMEKKIEYLIEMKFNKLKTELNEALGKIDSMTQDIGVLKNKVHRLNMGVTPQTKLAVEQPQAQPQQQPQQRQQKPAKEFNQRTGDFRPEDVSIEKMFYFGNK